MATSKYKDKDGGVLFSFNGIWVSWLHTIAAYGTYVCAVLLLLLQQMSISPLPYGERPS